MASLTMGNVWMYMDMGHGGWLGWPTPGLANIGPIVTNTISIAKGLNPLTAFRGFISNTANYDPWNGETKPALASNNTWTSCNNYGALNPANGSFPNCLDYNAAINEHIFQTLIIGPTFANLGAGLPTNWLFDSSRSGQAGIRQQWGSWCNIKGAGIGPRPAASPDSTDPALDAFVWIKPPGESDGNSSPTASHPATDGFCDCTTAEGADSLCPSPVAGQPFPAHFSMLVQNANPPFAAC
jgi:cellulose 1,4-beta-cellobiosidase